MKLFRSRLVSPVTASWLLAAALLPGIAQAATIDTSVRGLRIFSEKFLPLFQKEPWLDSELPEPVSTWYKDHKQQLICEWQTLPVGQTSMLLPRTMKVRIRFLANGVVFQETSETILAGSKAATAKATPSVDVPLEAGKNQFSCEVTARYETDGDYVVDPDFNNNRGELQVFAAENRFDPLYPEEMLQLAVEAEPEGSRFQSGASRTINLNVSADYRRAMSAADFVNQSGRKYVVETQVYWLAGESPQYIGRINTALKAKYGEPHYVVTHAWLSERKGGPGKYRLENRLLQETSSGAQHGPAVNVEIEFLDPHFKTGKGGVSAGRAPPAAGVASLLPDVAIVPAFKLATRSANWEGGLLASPKVVSTADREARTLHVPGAATTWDAKNGLCAATLSFSLINVGAMDAGNYFVYVSDASSDAYPREVVHTLARNERRDLGVQLLLAPGANNIRVFAQNRTETREGNELDNEASKRVVLDGDCREAMPGEGGVIAEEAPPAVDSILPLHAAGAAPPNPCSLEVSYYVPEAPHIRAGDAGLEAGDQVEISCSFRKETRVLEWAQCDDSARKALALIQSAQSSAARYSGIVQVDGNTSGVGSSPADGSDFTRTQLWSFMEPGTHEIRCQTDNALRFAEKGAATYLDNGVSVEVAARASARTYRSFDTAAAVAVGTTAVPSAVQPRFAEGRIRLSGSGAPGGGRTGLVNPALNPQPEVPSRGADAGLVNPALNPQPEVPSRRSDAILPADANAPSPLPDPPSPNLTEQTENQTGEQP